MDIKILDFGLSEFYFEHKERNTGAGTRQFKPPEILSGYKHFGYAFDIWSFGTIMASIIYKNYPFFKGDNNDD